jgi:hypothetical protein
MNYGALKAIPKNKSYPQGVPRQAELMGQPHMLAYINPQEEQVLRDMGGAGIPGPDGIPVYGWFSDTIKEITSGGKAETKTYNSGGSSAPTTSLRPVARTTTVNNNATTAVPDTNKNYVVGSGGNISGKNISGKNISTLVKPTATTTNKDNSGNNVSAYVPPVVQQVKVEIPNYETTKTNSFRERVANFLTPFDNTIYKDGNLVQKDNPNLAATNVGTKTFYGSVGVANDPKTGAFVNPDMRAMQTASAEKGKTGSVLEYAKNNLGIGVLGALVPGAGMFLTAANALGAWEVGPNPKDESFGKGADGQEIFQNAGGKFYSKGKLGNYYFVKSGTDSTPTADMSNASGPAPDYSGNSSSSGNLPSGAQLGDATSNAGNAGNYGGLYGSKSGGIWDRFRNSYLTRFNDPQSTTEAVRAETQADGSLLYFDVNGNQVNPDTITEKIETT